MSILGEKISRPPGAKKEGLRLLLISHSPCPCSLASLFQCEVLQTFLD